ncbi:hypothetical protein [Ochrovirga pacifica]|uniref:hypothetical protein n=1 Tax=Ochrovirga pacifica TaxID=1042376 RepID=UPI0002557B8D|nr:hypothetical protein [Ochrovirga pacifica]
MTGTKIVFKNALKIYALIVGFYFLIKVIGFSHIMGLRFVNILFVLWGVNTAIKTNITERYDSVYFNNLFVGFATSFLAVLATLISMVLYVSFIDDSLLLMLQQSSFWGNHLTLPRIVFAMTIEGAASCIISTFMLMQYWKKHKVTSYVS